MTPLDTEFLFHTKQLLQRVPVTPPSGDVSMSRGTKNQSFTTLKLVNDEDRIAFVKLEDSAARPGALGFELERAPTLALHNRADYVSIWWLPWSPGHMVKLKIAPTGTALQDAAGNALNNPGIFVTAALSGCSIFATGNPNAPSVYHGGLEDRLPHFFSTRGDQLTTFAPNGTAEEFWETVLNGVDNFQGTKPARDALYEGNNQSMAIKARGLGYVPKTLRATTKSINRSNYVNQGGTFTTPAATAYQQFVANQNQNDFHVESAQPWGAVFGIRDAGGNWKFYLQENATVSYFVFRKRKKYLWSDKTNVPVDLAIDVRKVVNKVIRLTRFYPGAGHAKPGTGTSILT